MGIGQNFYGDNPGQEFSNLSRQQSGQSLQYGDQAARYADPFMSQRGQYQNQLSELMKNPGSFGSSPTYQFAFDQGLEALNRRSAATGKTGSGNYLADLMKYGQGMASQQFFPQANLLAQLAQGGSNPGAAGASFALGTARSQDQAQMGAAVGAYGRNAPQQQQQQQPWWMQPTPGAGGAGTGLPSGGAMPYQNNLAGYSRGGVFGNPSSMSPQQLNAEASMLGLPTIPYQPGYGLPGRPQQGNTGFAYQPNQQKTLSGDNPWGWDMSNDPFAPASLQGGNTLSGGSFGGGGGGYDPSQPYGDYEQGGYD